MIKLKKGSLKVKLLMALKNSNKEMILQEIYSMFSNEKKSTCRGRLNEAVKQGFVKRTAEGTYKLIGELIANDESVLVVINGDGRKMKEIEENSVSLLLSDHPWLDLKSNKGGNRSFDGSYADTSFNYTQEDMDVKYSKLKSGAFLVEVVAEENANNFRYIYQIKDMALKAGFEYYACVDWHKEGFIANTGRKSKETEQILIFSKGKSRSLRLDKKKILQGDGEEYYMSGAAEMLPTRFSYPPAKRNEKIHSAEKPIALYEKIITLLTKRDEVVVEQFGGSCNAGAAILKTGRIGVIYELIKETYQKGLERVKTYGKHEGTINI